MGFFKEAVKTASQLWYMNDWEIEFTRVNLREKGRKNQDHCITDTEEESTGKKYFFKTQKQRNDCFNFVRVIISLS